MRIFLPLLAVLAAALVGCTHRPPTAVPESASDHYRGSLNNGTPLVSLVRDRHIAPLDPDARTSLLDQAMAALGKSDPGGKWRGITYDLNKTNALPRDWLVQTPLVWGQPAAIVGPGGAISLVERIGRLIATARQSVDIAALQPAPDGAFLRAIHDGLQTLARSGRPVTVRILVGQYPPSDIDTAKLLAALGDALQAPRSRLALYVGAMRSCSGGGKCDSFSWNHAKIVAVDGRTALVGGHNMYDGDYLQADPVFDLSMQIDGPAAASAMRFADAMWSFVCANLGKLSTVAVSSLLPGSDKPGRDCKASLAPSRVAPGGGGVPVLAVGRLASGITTDFANQSDLARDLMLGAARRSLRIVQQDIGFTMGRADTLYPESTLEKIADFLLLDRGEVYLVVSSLDSVGGEGDSYSNGVSLQALAQKIYAVVQKRSQLDRDTVTDMLCRRLHLAPIRFGPDAKWQDGKPIANHAKFWMVDDRYFYIGSDNLYPVDLQEFGFIVDDRAAAARLVKEYWDPLWRWSRRAAVSGADASNCILRDPPPRPPH